MNTEWFPVNGIIPHNPEVAGSSPVSATIRKPCNRNGCRVLFCLSTPCFPFSFPFSAQKMRANENRRINPLAFCQRKGMLLCLGNRLDVGLHSFCTGLLHLIGHMTVYVQGESCGRMP